MLKDWCKNTILRIRIQYRYTVPFVQLGLDLLGVAPNHYGIWLPRLGPLLCPCCDATWVFYTKPQHFFWVDFSIFTHLWHHEGNKNKTGEMERGKWGNKKQIWKYNLRGRKRDVVCEEDISWRSLEALLILYSEILFISILGFSVLDSCSYDWERARKSCC